MKISLLSRLFIIVVIFTALGLFAIWTILRPKYEASVISEHINTIQHLQTYAIEGLDHTIATWSDVTHFIARQVSERPKEGEIVLRSMVTLHPEIIQIKIQSPKLSDELTSQNTMYPLPNLQIKDSLWVRSKLDSLLHVAWIIDTSTHQHFFITQTRFQIENIPFTSTIVWDAKKLNTIFTEFPIGEGYSASIQSSSLVLLQNISSFKVIGVHGTHESAITHQSVRQNESNWHVLTNAFHTVQLWIIIAVPEKVILKPVEDFLFYSTICLISLTIIILFFGWMLSFQIKRPIARLIKDLQQLSNLDATKPIQIPAMKDIRGMGEAIEQMRQALEQYQHLNSESHYADITEKVETSIPSVSSTIQTNLQMIEFVNPPEPKTIRWCPSISLTAPEVNRPKTSNVIYEWRKEQTSIGNDETIEVPLNPGRNVFLVRAIDIDSIDAQTAEVEIVINCE